MIHFSLPLFSFLSLFLLYPSSFASVPPLIAQLSEHRGGGGEGGGKGGGGREVWREKTEVGREEERGEENHKTDE